MPNNNIQSVIFKKKYYTVPSAKKWLFKHKFKNNDVDIKPNYIRFRQQQPGIFDYYFLIEKTPAIKYVVGHKK